MTTVWLGAGVETALLAEAVSKAPLETGGVLLGWISGAEICITNVIGPGPAAVHEAESFEPDSSWQQDKIALLYGRSGRRLAYLGDWHTHPAGRPEPSDQDCRTLLAIANSSTARCPNPVMLILGQLDGTPWVASSHVYSPSPPRHPGSGRVTKVRTVIAPEVQGWDE